MTLFNGPLCRALALGLVLTGLSGCATPPKSTATVHVLVSAAGIVSVFGEHFSVDQLSSHLAKYGTSPLQEIRVHMEDIHNKRLMAQIFNSLHKKGYLRVMFQDEPRGVSEIVGEPESRTEMPVKNGALPAPNAK